MGQVLGNPVADSMYLCSMEKKTVLQSNVTQNVNEKIMTYTPRDEYHIKPPLVTQEAPSPQEDVILPPLAKDVVVRNGVVVQVDYEENYEYGAGENSENSAFPPAPTKSARGQHNRRTKPWPPLETYTPQPVYMGGYEAIEQKKQDELQQRIEEQRSVRRIGGFFNKGAMANVPVIEANTKRIVNQPDSIEDMFKFQHKDALRGEAARQASQDSRSSIFDVEFL